MICISPVSLALVGLFVLVTACTSYSQIEIGEVPDHGKVRVTMADGERETIRDPLFVGDTLKSGDVDYPMDQVTEVEAVGTNVVGTVAVVVGALVVSFFAVGLAICGGFGSCE